MVAAMVVTPVATVALRAVTADRAVTEAAPEAMAAALAATVVHPAAMADPKAVTVAPLVDTVATKRSPLPFCL